MPETLAGAMVALAIFMGIGLRLRHNRTRAKADRATRVTGWRAELDTFIQGAEKGDEEAIELLTSADWWEFAVSLDDPALTKRITTAVQTGKMVRFLASNLERMIGLRNAWQQAPDKLAGQKAATALLNALNGCADHYTGVTGSMQRIEHELGITYADVLDTLDKLLPKLLDELLDRAWNGDREAFVQAEELVNDTWHTQVYHLTSRFCGHNVTSLGRPGEWNELVVRYHRSPRLEQFATGSLEWRDYIALAADAVRDTNAVTAQMVIAACEANRWLRRQVGDTRHAELTLIASKEWTRRADVDSV